MPFGIKHFHLMFSVLLVLRQIEVSHGPILIFVNGKYLLYEKMPLKCCYFFLELREDFEKWEIKEGMKIETGKDVIGAVIKK